MLSIQVVNVFDDDVFDEWYTVMRTSVTHGRSAPTVWTRDALAFTHRDQTPKRRRLAVAALETDRAADPTTTETNGDCRHLRQPAASTGQKIIGTVSIALPLHLDTETAEVEVNVLPTERGRGVGAALWDWALAHCRNEGRTVFQCEVNVPEGEAEQAWPGLRFARARGFTSGNVEDHFALDAPVALAALAHRKEALTTTRGDGSAAYELVSWVDHCPESLVTSYAHLRTLMRAEVPTGAMVRTCRMMTSDDVRLEEQRLGASYRSLVTLALTSRGEPAGYTLIFVPLGDEANLLQDDTYVMRDHRGHRLGERLKWANLDQVQTVSPNSRWIHTWTEQDNTAMQRTNRDFGYLPVEVLHEVQLTL